MSHSYAHNAGWIPFGADAICHSMIMLWISAARYPATDGAIVEVPILTACSLNCWCTFFCPQEKLFGKMKKGKRIEKDLIPSGKLYHCKSRMEVKNQIKDLDTDTDGKKSNMFDW